MNMLDYEMEDMSTVQQARGTLESLIGAGGAALDGEGGAFLGNLFKAGTDLGGLAVTKIGGAIGDATASLGMGNPMSALKAYGRVSINPQKEMLFNAPAPRKYEFAFEFAPRNEKESLAVYDIIKALKHHAYPSRSVGRGFFFDMPAEFELEFHSIINGAAYENLWMNKIARCALVEINVDYTAAGSVSTFFNGAPTHINMTLTFQEMELITQEFVDRGY